LQLYFMIVCSVPSFAIHRGSCLIKARVYCCSRARRSNQSIPMDPHKQQHHWPPAERIHQKMSHSIHLYPSHSQWFRSWRKILILSFSAAAKHRGAMPNPLPTEHRRNVCNSICSWYTLTVPSAINSNKGGMAWYSHPSQLIFNISMVRALCPRSLL
jgi:hypothetical protein